MQIDFSQELISYDGEKVLEKIGTGEENSVVATLKSVSVKVLTAHFPEERPAPSGEDKFRRAQLAGRIYNAGPGGLDFSVEDLALIKKLIGMAYGPVVVGAAWPLLDGTPKEK